MKWLSPLTKETFLLTDCGGVAQLVDESWSGLCQHPAHGSHKPGGRRPLLSARPAIIWHHHSLTGTKLYCLVTEADMREQLARRRFLAAKRSGVEPATSQWRLRRPP